MGANVLEPLVAARHPHGRLTDVNEFRVHLMDAPGLGAGQSRFAAPLRVEPCIADELPSLRRRAGADVDELEPADAPIEDHQVLFEDAVVGGSKPRVARLLEDAADPLVRQDDGVLDDAVVAGGRPGDRGLASVEPIAGHEQPRGFVVADARPKVRQAGGAAEVQPAAACSIEEAALHQVVRAAALHLDGLRVVEAFLAVEVAVLHDALMASHHVDPTAAPAKEAAMADNELVHPAHFEPIAVASRTDAPDRDVLDDQVMHRRGDAAAVVAIEPVRRGSIDDEVGERHVVAVRQVHGLRATGKHRWVVRISALDRDPRLGAARDPTEVHPAGIGSRRDPNRGAGLGSRNGRPKPLIAVDVNLFRPGCGGQRANKHGDHENVLHDFAPSLVLSQNAAWLLPCRDWLLPLRLSRLCGVLIVDQRSAFRNLRGHRRDAKDAGYRQSTSLRRRRATRSPAQGGPTARGTGAPAVDWPVRLPLPGPCQRPTPGCVPTAATGWPGRTWPWMRSPR